MNITLLRLKPLLRVLQGIQTELARMNDMKELELAHADLHVRPHIADQSGEDPDSIYTDEEQDAIREMQEVLGKAAKDES